MKPNIILFMTDQQRWDTIGALGAPHAHTPNLDRLAHEGVSFDQCYCTAPSCAPSRASFFLNDWPHRTGVFRNGDRWGEHSWVSLLQSAGYHTVNVGKMHTQPMDAPCGFDQRYVVENKDRPLRLERPHGAFYDEWDRFLNNNGVRKPSRAFYKSEHPDYERALGAYQWPLEERYHPDVFVGTMARWFVEQRRAESPFFLQVGFPGPHPPYDPPTRHLALYDDTAMPLPSVAEEELALQPPDHALYRREMIEGNHDAVRWMERPDTEQLTRLRRHYMANVTLIDEQVGLILDALAARGYLDDAVVLFMSDHGEALGDHGHIQKWTMYDCVTRVPALAWAPNRLPAGARIGALLHHFDLVPFLFELAAVEPLAGAGVSALPVLKGETDGRSVLFAEHGRDNMLKEIDHVAMARTADWKLVYYLGRPYGELYDLSRDPGEARNLWDDPGSQSAKSELVDRIRDWRLASSVRG
jgi:arylsulfatase A-like enzyme